MSRTLNITVNGQPAAQPNGANIATIIQAMQLDGKRFAVERNALPRALLQLL